MPTKITPMVYTILIVFKERKVSLLPRRRRRRFVGSASVQFVTFNVGVDVLDSFFYLKKKKGRDFISIRHRQRSSKRLVPIILSVFLVL